MSTSKEALASRDDLAGVQRIVTRAMALMFVTVVLTGYYLGLTILGHVEADLHIVRGVHNSTLSGLAILAAYGWSLPMLRLGRSGLRWLTWGFVYLVNANWFFNTVRATLEVQAMQLIGEPANDIMFMVSNFGSALPIILCAAGWTYAAWGRKRAATADATLKPLQA